MHWLEETRIKYEDTDMLNDNEWKKIDPGNTNKESYSDYIGIRQGRPQNMQYYPG